MNKEPLFKPAFPLGSESSDDLLMLCRGTSMVPTLLPGDLLHVTRCGKSGVGAGDVVVFLPSDSPIPLAHRVVSRHGKEVLTRGDNNDSIDGPILAPVKIIGRVAFAERKGELLKIYGGVSGLLGAWRLRLRRTIPRVLRRFLSPVCRFLSHGVPLRVRAWGGSRLSVVAFASESRTQYRLFLRNKPVGRWVGSRGSWTLRFQESLWLDEGVLPSPDEGEERGPKRVATKLQRAKKVDA